MEEVHELGKVHGEVALTQEGCAGVFPPVFLSLPLFSLPAAVWEGNQGIVRVSGKLSWNTENEEHLTSSHNFLKFHSLRSHVFWILDSCCKFTYLSDRETSQLPYRVSPFEVL